MRSIVMHIERANRDADSQVLYRLKFAISLTSWHGSINLLQSLSLSEFLCR